MQYQYLALLCDIKYCMWKYLIDSRPTVLSALLTLSDCVSMFFFKYFYVPFTCFVCVFMVLLRNNKSINEMKYSAAPWYISDFTLSAQ